MSQPPEKKTTSTTDDSNPATNNINKPTKSALKTSASRSNNSTNTGTKLPPINKKTSTTTNVVANQKKRPMTAKGPRNKTGPAVGKFKKTVEKNANNKKKGKNDIGNGQAVKLINQKEENLNQNTNDTSNSAPNNDTVPIINEIKEEEEPANRTSGDEGEPSEIRRSTTPNIEALVHKAAFLLEHNASVSSRHNSQVWGKNSSTGKDNQSVEEGPVTMKASIPVLPMWLAIICCIFNFIIPGSGTIISGLSLLCHEVKKKKDRFRKLKQCLINVSVGVIQFACIVFCLIGWFWSIIWGTIMIGLARENAETITKSRASSMQASSSRASTFRDSIAA
ncbi:uncharacterized protein TRIADDRAFT_58994 [Trichoplax adhaerens]|uniref:Protein SPEC3 n=1 Tax=Trichoplax adhaerens TaxID=10228 RepID=B3S487_TRIAD|nr:hypothetical protein TRIADDRAFT_58994 [Trichoplax adhaerens]EDV22601.1 hypothetical protein TRIADDRAFT_58994 [Trichoplax adhaerens]|eukprot:XP_002115145.1 hypothetical protein TRIADDRAFT_58994 [Trichoplax adhaerens]